MPIYDYGCKKCQCEYTILTKTMSSREKDIKKAKCPECGSKSKKRIYKSLAGFNFSNPVGTDRWHSDSTGHDYRHKHNMDRPGGVRDQRKQAEEKSHMGANPYPEIDDISSGKHFGEVK